MKTNDFYLDFFLHFYCVSFELTVTGPSVGHSGVHKE